ncbi:hypothetical protein FM036_45015 [Nostoc sp. HG1]|nr:hypothetical protein [Nostoc sp. HG1]
MGDITVVGGTVKDGANNATVKKPIDYWEIKMAWSEYRNGKWTQKQLSAEAAYDIPTSPNSLPDVSSYEFIPRFFANPSEITIDIYQQNLLTKSFQFAGSQVNAKNNNPAIASPLEFNFHYTKNNTPPQIHSLQTIGAGNPDLGIKEPYFDDQKTLVEIHYQEELSVSKLNFYHPFAHELLSKLMTSNLDGLFDYYLNQVTDKVDAYGGRTDVNGNVLYHELKRSYSLYNWEAAFHAPMQLVDSLLKSQKFEQALKMCHYVFNPLAKGTGKERFWQFAPFKEVDAEDVLEKLFIGLQPNTPDIHQAKQINEWRDKPFQPHVIARSRPSAYMKWVVMKYIEILIAWGGLFIPAGYDRDPQPSHTALCPCCSYLWTKRTQNS